jgi:hypothetical protein
VHTKDWAAAKQTITEPLTIRILQQRAGVPDRTLELATVFGPMTKLAATETPSIRPAEVDVLLGQLEDVVECCTVYKHPTLGAKDGGVLEERNRVARVGKHSDSS